MTVFQLLSKYYPEVLFKLKKHFPGLLDFSKRVPVLPWKDEYNVADRNPEVIENLKVLENLLEKGVITEQEYREKSSDLLKEVGYTSRTEGIAFIEEGFVAFRDEKPSLSVILHELGHVYFREPDLFWNAVYSGGEVLFWLALNERYKISEEQIIEYMNLLKRAYEEPENLGRELTKKIAEKVNFKDCVPHLYAYMLYAGTMPTEDNLNTFIVDPADEKILSIPYSTQGILSFLSNLVEGLKYQDSFYITYAKALKIVG